jgi:hypothetical protein
MTDWATISSLATAGCTVLLAGATLSSVRSASRAAAAAERAVLVGMRPTLLTSRLDDRAEKVFWVDEHWARVEGGHAYAKVVDGNLYMAVSLRNSGQGLAVLQSWYVSPDRLGGGDQHAEIREFRRQQRDLFVPAQDVGYWHAAIRDPEDPWYGPTVKAVEARESFTVEVLYSDAEGGQRCIARFTMRPRGEADAGDWLAASGRHWNLDRPDPRGRA